MKRFNIYIVLFLLGMSFLPLNTVMAAGAHGKPKPNPGAGCWPPPCVPIDGGISFLVAAGIGLGAKKLYDSRKR